MVLPYEKHILELLAQYGQDAGEALCVNYGDEVWFKGEKWIVLDFRADPTGKVSTLLVDAEKTKVNDDWVPLGRRRRRLYPGNLFRGGEGQVPSCHLDALPNHARRLGGHGSSLR